MKTQKLKKRHHVVVSLSFDKAVTPEFAMHVACNKLDAHDFLPDSGYSDANTVRYRAVVKLTNDYNDSVELGKKIAKESKAKNGDKK
jgi:hypothetical protein